MIEFEAEIPEIDLGDLGFEVREIDLALEAGEARAESHHLLMGGQKGAYCIHRPAVRLQDR